MRGAVRLPPHLPQPVPPALASSSTSLGGVAGRGEWVGCMYCELISRGLPASLPSLAEIFNPLTCEFMGNPFHLGKGWGGEATFPCETLLPPLSALEQISLRGKETQIIRHLRKRSG